MKFIKISLYIITGLFVVVLLSLGVFVATFDANEYRPQISEQVKKHTGRDLSLGDIKPSVFPWLGIELQQVSLSNAEGFAADNMLQVERLDVRVELFPLLLQELRVDTLRLHGLNLSLAKNKQGKTNWDDILQKQQSKEGAPSTPVETTEVDVAEQTSASPLAALMVNGIEIKDANIEWQDALTNQSIALNKFNLNSGAIRQGQSLPLELTTQVNISEPEASIKLALQTNVAFDQQTQQLDLDGFILNIDAALKKMQIDQAKIEMKTGLKANLDKQTFVLPALSLEISATGKDLPNGKVDALINADANINLQQQTAKIKQLSVKTMDLTLQSQLSVTGLVDAPNMSGDVKLLSFNPAELMQRLAIVLPEMKNKEAMKKAAVSFDFSANEKSLQLKALHIIVDQSNIKGELTVKQFDKAEISYQLALDYINLDDYLSPPSDVEAASMPANEEATASSASQDTPIDLPVEMLRTLNVKGRFDAKAIQGFDQSLTNFRIDTNIKNGIVNVPVIKVDVLEGNINASAKLDVTKNTPHYSMLLDGKGINADSLITPILQDMSGEQAMGMSGAVNLNLNVTSKGQSVKQITANSNGKVKLNVGKAELRGVDAEYFVRKAVVGYMEEKKQNVQESWRGTYQPKDTTALKTARATAIIRNGVVDNKDLLLDSKRFKITGAGKINLPKEQLDYRVVLDVIPVSTKTTGERLMDIPMPIFIRGNFAQPKISIDKKIWLRSVGKQLKLEAKAKVKQATEKKVTKQKEKVKQKKEEIKDELKDKVKDKFNNLFR